MVTGAGNIETKDEMDLKATPNREKVPRSVLCLDEQGASTEYVKTAERILALIQRY
jgi:hypothetical protein